MTQVINVLQKIEEEKEQVAVDRHSSWFSKIYTDEDGNIIGIDKKTGRKVLVASNKTAHNEGLFFVS